MDIGHRLSQDWWLVALRGAIAILFGILAIALPWAAAQAFLILVGVYLLVDGLVTLATFATHLRVDRHAWVSIGEGLISVIAGLACIAFPAMAAVAFVWTVALWALLTGILEIAAGVRLHEAGGEGLLVVGGVVSIVLALFLFLAPGVGVVAWAWSLGLYAILFGISLMAAGLRLRQVRSPLLQRS